MSSSECMADKPVEDHHPQFTKFLMPGFPTKLGIPHDFLKYIKSEKLETATIVVSPIGKPWCIKVQGEIPSLYFGEGWSDFVQFHDLRLGYFLVFRHQGNMLFTVRVFDKSCCKKEYLPDMGGVKNKKIRRDNPNPEIFNKSKYDSDGRKLFGIASYGSTRFPHTIIPSSCSQIEAPSAFRAATDISTKHEITLRDPDKRLFPVRLYQTAEKQTIFGKGWRGFYHSNNLKTGDVCEFQYSSEENTMQVRIFKQSITPREPAADSNDKTKAKEADPTTHYPKKRIQKKHALLSEALKSMGTTTSSCTGRFRLTITTPYLKKSCMYIPHSNRGATRILSLRQVILKDPEGRLFLVGISHSNRNRPNERFFTSSWKQFYVSNDLKRGDTCEFQLVDDAKEKNLVQVQIFRA